MLSVRDLVSRLGHGLYNYNSYAVPFSSFVLISLLFQLMHMQISIAVEYSHESYNCSEIGA